MMKKITLLFLVISVFTVKAQNKTTVAFLPMSYNEETLSKNEAKIIQETVINAFVSSKKFTVVDREKLEDLEREKNLQRSDAFLDSQDGFTAGLSKGASFIVDGSIVTLRHSEVKGRWTTNINVQLRLLDVSTGEIMATESVSAEFVPESAIVKKAMKAHFSKEELKVAELKSEQLQAAKDYKEDAFNTALVRLSENISRFTSSLLPLHADIVSWDAKKNEVVLGAGNAMGVQPGQVVDIVKFSVVTVGESEIRRSEVIGAAWIVRVDDQNFSVASIIDNLKEVSKATKANEKIGVIIR